MVDTWARPKGEMQERSEWTTDCSSIRWSRLMTIMGSTAISQAGGQTGPSSGRSIRWFWVAGWTCIMLAPCSRPSLHTSGISGDTLFSTPLLNDIWLSNLYANWECYSSRLDSEFIFSCLIHSHFLRSAALRVWMNKNPNRSKFFHYHEYIGTGIAAGRWNLRQINNTVVRDCDDSLRYNGKEFHYRKF